MRVLSDKQLNNISGGQDGGTNGHMSSCSNAVINFLRYQGDMFSALLAQDISAQNQAAEMMSQYQKIAMEDCSYVDLMESGCVGAGIFLYP